MGGKKKPVGRLGNLVEHLKKLLDESTNYNEIVLKYLSLNVMAGKKDTIEQLLGREHWTKLQTVLKTIRDNMPELGATLQMGKPKQNTPT